MILDNEFSGDMRVENEVQALVNAGHEVFVFLYYLWIKTRERELPWCYYYKNSNFKVCKE